MIFAFYGVIVIHVMACLFLIGVVLLQQGKNQDLASAFGGGGTQTAFGPRGSANVLSKATTILAGVFMITCLALSVLRTRPSGILDRVSAPPPSSKPAVPPVQPVAPPASSAAAPASSAAPAANPPAAPANPAAAPASKPTAPPSK